MAENMNLIFSELVGDTYCKFDGEVWTFEEEDATDTVVIPVRAISCVQLTKVRSWLWLFLLIIAIIAVAVGVFISNMIAYGIAVFFGLLAVVSFIFSVEYTVTVTPYSDNEMKIASRRRPVLDGLFAALFESLHTPKKEELTA